jgi:hypothetical protein
MTNLIWAKPYTDFYRKSKKIVNVVILIEDKSEKGIRKYYDLNRIWFSARGEWKGKIIKWKNKGMIKKKIMTKT